MAHSNYNLYFIITYFVFSTHNYYIFLNFDIIKQCIINVIRIILVWKQIYGSCLTNTSLDVLVAITDENVYDCEMMV